MQTEDDILDRAIAAIERETGLRLDIEQRDVTVNEINVDATVRLANVKKIFNVEIKKWVQHANVGALINQLQRLPENKMLAADYINPKMAEKLRQQNIQFIDTVGNAFIDQPPIHVQIKGNRPEKVDLRLTRGAEKRAFEPKGLRVIYAFLCNPEVVNAPYREIADITGTAVGTVGWVLNGLKETGFVRTRKTKKQRYLANYRKLLDRWIEEWPRKLRPKQLVDEFTTKDPHWWEMTEIVKYGGYWGGEIAAAKYTNNLKPQIGTVYIPKLTRNDFLRETRLRKTDNLNGEFKNGTVLIYEPFWKAIPDPGSDNNNLVHPVLTYADLIETGDPRNLEVAREVFDDHIAQYCREN